MPQRKKSNKPSVKRKRVSQPKSNKFLVAFRCRQCDVGPRCIDIRHRGRLNQFLTKHEFHVIERWPVKDWLAYAAKARAAIREMGDATNTDRTVHRVLRTPAGYGRGKSKNRPRPHPRSMLRLANKGICAVGNLRASKQVKRDSKGRYQSNK